MDIYELLRRDHHEIDSLLSRLQQPVGRANFDAAGRRYLLDHLVPVASRHEAAEELVFWPEVRRRLPDGAALADEGLQAERGAKAVLDLLRAVSSETELTDTAAELQSLARAHARFEEDTVFPQMAKHSTRLWAAFAGIRFRMARRSGPTRPHPKGPDRPAGLLTRGAPAVLADHVRDLSHRRPRKGFDEPGRADAVAVLREDHDRIGGLLRRIETDGAEIDPEDRLVHSLIRELSIHDAIERQYLYPVIRRRLQDGNTRYRQAMSEHGQIARLAATLDAYRFHDEARTEWLRQLAIDVRTHIEQEEEAILPALAARMTPEELVELGALLEAARAKAPTRPHPHLSGAGTGTRLSRLVATPIDKARDVIAGRRTA